MIKSQDDLPTQGRESEVLLETIEKAKFWFTTASDATKKLRQIKKIVSQPKRPATSKVIGIYMLLKDFD